MRISVPPLSVAPDDGFKNDVLGRSGFGQALMNLASNAEDELVICLDAPWGEGKTTFVKMWQGLLAEQQIPSVYIDAFAHDYSEDAFVVIASALTEFVESNIVDGNEAKVSEFREKAKRIGARLLGWSARVGIKAATLGAIRDADIDALDDIKADVQKNFSGVVGDFVDERFRSHSQVIRETDAFRQLLATIPEHLGEAHEAPLIVILDELDRCRPPFAVEVVERVKHLFSVPRVVFVLVMNKSQLEQAVKSVYGEGLDAHAYLQKFITIEAKLPKKRKSVHQNDLGQYARYLLRAHQIQTWGDDRNLIEYVDLISNELDVSLRQLEKVFSVLAVFYASTAENNLRLIPLIVLLAFAKVVHPHIFNKLLAGRATYSEVVERFGFSSAVDADENGRLWSFSGWVRYSLLSEQEFNALPEDDPIRKFGETELWRYNISRERLLPVFAELIGHFVP